MKSRPIPSHFRLRFLSLTLGLAAAGITSRAAEGEWISLFDGKSFAGWKASENPASFRIADGAITTDGPRAHLFYLGEGATPASFENFELSVEVMTKPGANSGVYFHTSWLEQGWPTHQGFEVQVDTSQPLQGNYIENKHTGSLYGIRNVYPRVARDNEWFTLNVTVRNPRVEIRVNGVLVVDYIEPADPLPAGAPKFNHLGSGTFALQAHDPASHASFRNIRVRLLPALPPGTIEQPLLDSELAQILPLAKDNFPLIDLNTVINQRVTLDRALAHSRNTGVGLGIVAYDPTQASGPVPALGYPPVKTEAAAIAFLERMKGQPVFLVLRPVDWVKSITPKTLARFDCIIADGALIMPPATDDNAQGYMDKLVDDTVAILSREPVDIYGSPTSLPLKWVSRADELWTEARMQKIIAAAVSNNVAIEINHVRVLPSEKFLRLAKTAGAKFSIGSGFTRYEVFDRGYVWEMQRRLGLTWRNMYEPGQQPTRAQREIAALGAKPAP